MDKMVRESSGHWRTGILAGALSGALAGTFTWLLAPRLVDAFRQTAAWVLPTIFIGILAIGIVCVLLLPLCSRRRSGEPS